MDKMRQLGEKGGKPHPLRHAAAAVISRSDQRPDEREQRGREQAAQRDARERCRVVARVMPAVRRREKLAQRAQIARKHAQRTCPSP